MKQKRSLQKVMWFTETSSGEAKEGFARIWVTTCAEMDGWTYYDTFQFSHN